VGGEVAVVPPQSWVAGGWGQREWSRWRSTSTEEKLMRKTITHRYRMEEEGIDVTEEEGVAGPSVFPPT
jgi:hypothetical protein